MSSLRQVALLTSGGLVLSNQVFQGDSVDLRSLVLRIGTLAQVEERVCCVGETEKEHETVWLRDSGSGNIFVIVCLLCHVSTAQNVLNLMYERFSDSVMVSEGHLHRFQSQVLTVFKPMFDMLGTESEGGKQNTAISGRDVCGEQCTAPITPRNGELESTVDNTDIKTLAISGSWLSSQKSTDTTNEWGSFVRENKLIKKFRDFGKSNVDREAIQPIIASVREKLLERNVTSEVVDLILGKVVESVVGTEVTSWESLSTVLERALEAAIIRLLSSVAKVDVLTDVKEAKISRRPYVIAFIGVNGVGKSTSLSKLVYWLNQQNLSVMVAACDTFRAGAVEQLRTHCQRLGCALFERGYEKDPATIAQQAIQQAMRQGTDVVMIDTAGRMQDNEPLMRSLAKLLTMNKPDLTLFVGEALVGGDGVSQIVEFERRLLAFASSKRNRVIDGIFLSKFDTIDDKVGTALSLVYMSSVPILFVGVGQTYEDIRRFEAQTVARALLKS